MSAKGERAASPTPSANSYSQRDNDKGNLSLHAEQKSDDEKLATSRDTSGDVSPAPSNDGQTEDDTNIISFTQDDPTNPYNWSRKKKIYVVVTAMVMVLNSTMGSALPSGATGATSRYYDVESDELLVLPVSIYLIGYILGPMIFAPLSESYGRKIVMICTFIMFTIFVMACAVAPTFASLVVFRMFTGIGASTPVSVIGGILADMYSTSRARGMAITAFMAATTWGPLLGPLLSGYITMYISWRWVYWVELMFAGATWPFLLFMSETYGPVILRRRAKKLRKETGDHKIKAPSELEKQDLWELITTVLTRPIRMMLFEAIVSSTCLFLSLEYGIFYIFFQAFDPIFADTYGFTPGQVGLAFLPIGVGSIFAAAIYLWWDYYLDRARNKPTPPAWSRKEEFVRLPLACLGGPLIVISLFWLGWTARADIHWIVPILAVLPFGIGFLLIFMALINYVVDAYEIYAASAMGATSAARSVFGVVLPFASSPMYATLGVPWACTLLGILSALMCLIPFVFIKYGEKIRSNSKFCQELKKKKADGEEKQRRLWERQRSRQEPDLEKGT
ncbi:uncharacterized protein LTR77_009671 [Saxophila tyrrhenica]|uniref:Major facilitator superfamily (MFS) profile domain-containing protein n=1 Tax=Saxophila tyrrhenica TaxID=1690608 RepID=A0AAV9NZJ5_9PEZI|nr:hypothetical protein LTR77_009671 [Saxophila tyrrhenica]